MKVFRDIRNVVQNSRSLRKLVRLPKLEKALRGMVFVLNTSRKCVLRIFDFLRNPYHKNLIMSASSDSSSPSNSSTSHFCAESLRMSAIPDYFVVVWRRYGLGLDRECSLCDLESAKMWTETLTMQTNECWMKLTCLYMRPVSEIYHYITARVVRWYLEAIFSLWMECISVATHCTAHADSFQLPV